VSNVVVGMYHLLHWTDSDSREKAILNVEKLQVSSAVSSDKTAGQEATSRYNVPFFSNDNYARFSVDSVGKS